jgi:hypothetical protein
MNERNNSMVFRTLRTAALSLAVVATLALSSACAYSQKAPAQKASPSVSDMSVPDTDAPHNWTNDQIITATVHQAWILSGKNEANFFEIIKELAEISARNRNLTLPDNPIAGRRAGAYIKAQAKLDHDQLLYAIVDKSVRMTGTKSAGTPHAAD